MEFDTKDQVLFQYYTAVKLYTFVSYDNIGYHNLLKQGFYILREALKNVPKSGNNQKFKKFTIQNVGFVLDDIGGPDL